MKNLNLKIVSCTTLVLFSLLAHGQTQVPNTFQSGQPARAAEVNENFSTLETAVNANAADIQQVQGLAGLSTAAAQIQTGLDLTSGLRWLIADFYMDQGVFPLSNAELGAPSAIDWSNRFVLSAAVVSGGIIQIYFGNDADPLIANQSVSLIPRDPGSAVVWFECSGDGATDVYLAELDCAFSDAPYKPIYDIRRQIETAFDLLGQSDAQQSIQDFYNTYGLWPTDNSQASLGPPGTYQNHYITQLVVSGGGVITMTFGGWANFAISGGTLSWTPTDNGNSIQWTCSSPDIAAKYLPPVCR